MRATQRMLKWQMKSRRGALKNAHLVATQPLGYPAPPRCATLTSGATRLEATISAIHRNVHEKSRGRSQCRPRLRRVPLRFPVLVRRCRSTRGSYSSFYAKCQFAVLKQRASSFPKSVANDEDVLWKPPFGDKYSLLPRKPV